MNAIQYKILNLYSIVRTRYGRDVIRRLLFLTENQFSIENTSFMHLSVGKVWGQNIYPKIHERVWRCDYQLLMLAKVWVP